MIVVVGFAFEQSSSFILGILTRQDFELYYHGERCTSDQPQSLTCPFCGEMGLALPFLSESSSSSSNNASQGLDLFHHVQMKHSDDSQSSEVICPICAAMANGEPNLMTADLLSHIANDHQQMQVQTPSSAGSTSNPYSRQTSSNRDIDFGAGYSSGRAGFRRGPLRAPGRRGTGLGRGGGTVSQHFVVDPSSIAGATDPIADLLTQLSTVRRLAAATNNSSSSSNTINLQTLTRQQYERERLRAAGRTHQNQQQQPSSYQSQGTSSNSSTSSTSNSTSTLIPSAENDFFDSLFSSALFIDPSSSSTATQQTWAQVVAQHPPVPEQQQQQQTSVSSTTRSSKTSASEPDPSLLRKICEESSAVTPSSHSTNTNLKRRTDFVHSLLFTSVLCPVNDNDK